MRISLLLSVACSAVVLLLVATPSLGVTGADTGTDPYCLLKSLDFTGGLYIIGDFQPSVFAYTCSCADFGAGPFTVIPRMDDPGSSAEITFNGVGVNTKLLDNAISNSDSPLVADSPARASVPLTFVTGTNVIDIGVSCNGMSSPPCYYHYVITCYNPGSGSSVVGDPQFVGLRGQNYQIHGVSGEVYNIVSDADLQYNSRFVFLDQGECPVINGRKQKGCFSHPGSYLGELGLKTRAGDQIHVATGSAKNGFAGIELNGKSLEIGESILLAGDLGSVSLNSTHVASVQIGQWSFVFENSDMYLNQKVSVLDSRGLRSHGLLGQTWRDVTYPNAIKYIQGVVDDYVIREKNLFGDSFVYNTFN